MRPLSDQKVTKIPDTVTFECEFSPVGLQIDWYKADRQIRGLSEKYEISSEAGVHRLKIKDVDGRDIGAYSARYRNKETTAKLEVEGEFIISRMKPQIQSICNLLAKCIGILHKAKNILPTKTLAVLYYTIFELL